MLYHSFAPSKPLPILEQLRKDSKDPKLKKSIEKLFATTRDSKTESTADKKPATAKPAKTVLAKRKTTTEQARA